MGAGTSITLIDKVSDWVVSQALTNITLDQLVDGTCEHLAAAGVPISRVNFTFSVLHPLYDARGFHWRRGEGTTVDHIRLQGGDSRYTQSPYFHLASHDLQHMRRRLEDETCADFPILKDLFDQGMTDYLAFSRNFEDQPGKGIFGSWATAQVGGFSEADIAALLRIQKRLAVTAKVAVLKNLAQNAITTYLGKDAGNRVMDGQIRRGDGETIRAAIVMGDIRGSTQLAETLGRQGYIDTLNLFFDNVASAFSDAGGEILSFVGDGFLAIFPCNSNTRNERTRACQTASHAAFVATARMRAANAERVKNGDDEIHYGLGLHIGNVMFGNVGLADRLTFSAFGAAVNEAARLESLTKVFDSHIIASDEFRDRCEGEWRSFGKQVLRGVEEEMEIHGPTIEEIKNTVCDGPKCTQEKPLSDAENIVLLQQAKSA
jgi:adenylate cyclase